MSKFSNFICSASVLAALALPAFPAWADGDRPSNISGLESFGPEAIIVVTDAKTKSQEPRVSVMTVGEKGNKYMPVTIEQWSVDDPKAQAASDIESICEVPGEPGHFYAFESGYWKDGSGRAFKIHVNHHPFKGWIGQVEQVVYPFAKPAGGTTSDHEQIEGSAAIKDGDGVLYFLLGLRGSPEHPGQLVVSRLDGDKVVEVERHKLDLRNFLNGRSCSDLMLCPTSQPNEFDILSSGCIDSSDLGPFSSVICKVGTLEIAKSGYKLKMTDPQLMYIIDGLKVEALCPTPVTIEGSHISIGTDSENFEPIFRPLPIK
ncbi:hypothetical protein IJT93_02345 [bacterium]|nr:hypothetical protein [bacterium]